MNETTASTSAAIASGGAAQVYFGGAIRPALEAAFSAVDHGVLFGLGFFETFRTSGGRPHQVARHWRRLLTACDETGIAVPADFLARDGARLVAATVALLRARGLRDAVFRYTLTAGAPRSSAEQAGLRYAQPRELLTLRALPPPAPAEGAALRVLALPRETTPGRARPKSLNHANALRGTHELERRGATAADEGLFLDRDGFVVETTRQAIAWVRGGRLCFPAPELGPIDSTGLAWAREQVADARAERAPIDDLIGAEAVFAINGVRGVTPIRELWDAADRVRLATFDSARHSLVGELTRRWSESLRRTAEGVE